MVVLDEYDYFTNSKGHLNTIELLYTRRKSGRRRFLPFFASNISIPQCPTQHLCWHGNNC